MTEKVGRDTWGTSDGGGGRERAIERGGGPPVGGVRSERGRPARTSFGLAEHRRAAAGPIHRRAAGGVRAHGGDRRSHRRSGDHPGVLCNSTVGVVQELRADRAVTALSQLSTPAVRVLRDGLETKIPASGLVRGDVVLLGEGDVVPADGTVLEASALLVDESALTGESVPVGKRGPQARGSASTSLRGPSSSEGGAWSRSPKPARPARWGASRP